MRCLCLRDGLCLSEVSLSKGGSLSGGVLSRGLCPEGLCLREGLCPGGLCQGSKHPTGMHSCFICLILLFVTNTPLFAIIRVILTFNIFVL